MDWQTHQITAKPNFTLESTSLFLKHQAILEQLQYQYIVENLMHCIVIFKEKN